jgi:cytochrome c-type biogenesis protein
VFVVMSVLLYGLFLVMSGLNRILNVAAGSLVILLGVNTLSNFIPFLRYSTEEVCETCTPEHSLLAAGEGSILHPTRRPKGFLGSFLVGLAFGAGWTPCVGTLLGSILLMASQSETLARSVVYLVVYSAGLGVPFLLAALFWGTLFGYVAKIKRAMPVIRVVSGIFLIAMGILMLWGRFFLLNAYFLKTGYALSGWAESAVPGVGLIPGALFLVIAAIPLVCSLVRKRAVLRPRVLIPAGVFLLLAVLNSSGVINVAGLLSRWFTFSGL